MTLSSSFKEHETYEVTGIETFFPLVYVFTLSQLASYLAEHLSMAGGAAPVQKG